MLVDQTLNRSPDAFRVLNDFIRAEADNAPTLVLHHRCTSSVRLDLVGVEISIDLDDQAFRYASEVGEVRSDRMLAAELDAFHSVSADQFPTDFLCATGIAPELTCLVRLSTHAPSPNLSP